MTKKGISRMCSWLGGIAEIESAVATRDIPKDGTRRGRTKGEEEKIVEISAT